MVLLILILFIKANDQFWIKEKKRILSLYRPKLVGDKNQLEGLILED